jgi:O-antigen ligase
MILKNKKLENINFIFLFLILSTIIFRSICTIVIILYIVFQISVYSKVKFKIKLNWLIIILSMPFLIEVLMFWNNDYIYYGLKSLEKKIIYLFLPFFILSSLIKIDVFRLINYWTKTMCIILICFLIRYVLFYKDNLTNYLNGIDVWDMGYSFARSIDNNHAPALNLIVSFCCISALYIFYNIKPKKCYEKIINFITYVILLCFVFLINTRIAVCCSVLGSIFITLYRFKSSFTIKHTVLITTLIFIFIIIFVNFFPYTIKKYTTVSFGNMDKIGKLDEIENPEGEIYNSLVTRLSIWKSAIDLSKRNIWFGVGASDGKRKLFDYYYQTDQMFLFKYKFPVHNQYLDYLVRFGIIGLALLFLFMAVPLYIGFKLHNSLIIFYSVSFIISNITDDFLIRFDGIVFSCVFISLFGYLYLRNQSKYFSE